MPGLVSRGRVGAKLNWVSSTWVDIARVAVAKSSQTSKGIAFGGRNNIARSQFSQLCQDS